ncbi:MAG: DUF3786 domain-containing protein [Deltaproteobacteria bacterium]|nr:DUF3786 domain-containing protein [Desulfitobacteriaceae bacterium]MDI6854622.1 DUF3786 domain-containing protein [Deltaproteobacteria bacterium]
MLYEKCAEVSQEFWRELNEAEPEEVARRTGAIFQGGSYQLPFLNRELMIDVKEKRINIAGAGDADPGFRACLTALLYLIRLDPAALGPLISAMEVPGGANFFQSHGPHALPNAPLEERFGQDLAGFLEAGRRLGAEVRAAGDASLAFQVFPGLWVEVVLWQADEEFPAQVSFMVPSQIDRFWHLDAVLGLMVIVVRELLAAAGGSN